MANPPSSFSKQSAIDALTTLGLSLGEAKTYATLVELGSALASTIARKANIPQPKIYGFLKKLETRGYVFRQEKRGAPDTFIAAPYEIVLDSLEGEISKKIRDAKRFFEETEKMQKTHEIEDLFAYYEGERAVYAGLSNIIGQICENAYIISFNKAMGPLIQELLLERKSEVEGLEIFYLELGQELWNLPVVKKLFGSRGFVDQLEFPCSFFTDVDFEKITAKSLNILLPAIEDFNSVLINIKHPLVFRLYLKLIKNILNAVDSNLVRFTNKN
ncbi:MAG: TrmB family transcriptional regulator [Candidatus Heimdallarchaeaceae archaeon]